MPIYVGTASSTSIHSTSVGIGTTTTAGRNAGVGTAIGSMVLNMDTGAFESFDGNRWIKTAGGDPITATGGNSLSVTSRPGFKVHIFTSPGTFSVTSGSGDIEYAFWGGGGGGSGHAGGGGGGGGGFRSGLLPVAPGPYSVTVGAGGAGGPDASGNGGTSGSNSSIAHLIAYGGGGGGDVNATGKNGGSGGGRGGVAPANGIGYGYNPSTPSPMLAPALQPLHPYPITQGYPGGEANLPTQCGGGGGGSAAVGGAGGSSAGGGGGAGTTIGITGSSLQKGGGGGAGAHSPGKSGGSAGAGGGAAGDPQGPNSKAPSASANTAGGGGGGGGTNGVNPSTGGDGGSGYVAIAYPIVEYQ